MDISGQSFDSFESKLQNVVASIHHGFSERDRLLSSTLNRVSAIETTAAIDGATSQMENDMLLNKCNLLEEKVKELSEKAASFELESKQQGKHLSALRNESWLKSKEIERLNSERLETIRLIEDERKSNERMKERITSLETALRQQEETVMSATWQMESVSNTSRGLISEFEELRRDPRLTVNSERLLQNLKLQVESLAVKAESERSSWQVQTDLRDAQAKRDIEALTEELSHKEEKLRGLERDIDEKDERMRELEAKLRESRVETVNGDGVSVRERTREVTENKAHSSLLTMKMNGDSKLRELETELREKTREANDLRRTMERMKNSWQAEKQRLDAALEQKKQETAVLAQEKEIEVSSMSKKLSEAFVLEQERSQLVKERIEKERDTLRNEIGKKEHELLSLRKENKQLAEMMQSLHQQMKMNVDQQERFLTDKCLELGQAKGYVAQLIQGMQEQKSRAEKQVKRLESEVSEKEETNTRLINELGEIERVVSLFSQEMEAVSEGSSPTRTWHSHTPIRASTSGNRSFDGQRQFALTEKIDRSKGPSLRSPMVGSTGHARTVDIGTRHSKLIDSSLTTTASRVKESIMSKIAWIERQQEHSWELEQQLSDLQEKLERMENEMSRQKEDNELQKESLEMEITTAASQVSIEASKHEALRSENETLIDRIAELERRITDEENEVAVTKSSLAVASRENRVILNRIRIAEDEKSRAQESLKTLEALNKSLSTDLVEKENELLEIRKEREELVRACSTANEARRVLESEIENLKKTFHITEAELLEKAKTENEAQNSLKRIEAEFVKVESSEKDTRTMLTQKEVEVQTLRSNFHRMEEEVKMLRELRLEHDRKWNQLNHELSIAEIRIGEKWKDTEKKDGELELLQKILSYYDKTLFNTKDELFKTQTREKIVEDERDRLRSKLAASEEELKKLRSRSRREGDERRSYLSMALGVPVSPRTPTTVRSDAFVTRINRDTSNYSLEEADEDMWNRP
ncbi:hypothetical protein BLNAU_5346 [Blattamonas nauphoetae]|uniref:Uncharacterized protein n=1 Tax=Blattamonas nauphoetae TaxID=2049346 RepID=A0ABQ9Y778_9EUKA|nr:hypothetical protein BLNAU_5346 [Blattamonas nauphoetae]